MEMKKIVHAQWNKYSSAFHYELFDTDMTEYGYVKLEEVVIEFSSMNDVELRRLAAEALKLKRRKLIAEHHVAEQQIEEEIQSLLALPAPAESE